MRIKTYRHKNIAGPMAGIGTSFATAKKLTIDTEYWPSGAPFLGRLHSLVIHVSAISSAGTITWRLCDDTAGDKSLVTDTAGALFPGITTATKGSASFRIDLDVGLTAGDEIYFFAKVDAGSVTIDNVILCWEE